MAYKPADEILAYDVGPGGGKRPIFGYKHSEPNKGMPVCFSRLPGRSHLRCQSIARCDNGRCNIHGGKSLKGAAHPSFRTGEWSAHLPKNVGDRLLAAAQDPEYLSLRDELAFNAAHIMGLMEGFNHGTDEGTWDRILAQVELIETLMFCKEVSSMLELHGGPKTNVTKLSYAIEELVKLVRYGRNEKKLYKEIESSMESRRKLVETDLKREQMQANNMPADEVLALFLQVVGVVKKVFKKDVVGLKIFAQEIDSLSSIGLNNTRALGGTPGVAGQIEPKSIVGSAAREPEISDSIFGTQQRQTKPMKLVLNRATVIEN